MPLPPLLPEPDLASARALRDQARDMEDHMDQTIPRMVQGADGWLYLAAAGTETDQIDVDPYPRMTPQSNLEPRIGDNAAAVMFDAESRINRMDARLSDYGHQNVQQRTQPFTDAFLRANPVKFIPQHPFQVAYFGKSRWYVSPGTFGADNYDVWPRQDWPGGIFTGTDGYIVATVDVTSGDSAAHFRLRGLSFVTYPTNNPAAVTGEDDDGHDLYSAGWHQLPVARVRVTRQSLFIGQVLRDNIAGFNILNYHPYF